MIDFTFTDERKNGAPGGLYRRRLSGKQQHMVGIVGARVMVAINNDAKSPIFEQVDYGIVDDCREFLPALIEQIKQYQEKKIPANSQNNFVLIDNIC